MKMIMMTDGQLYGSCQNVSVDGRQYIFVSFILLVILVIFLYRSPENFFRANFFLGQ